MDGSGIFANIFCLLAEEPTKSWELARRVWVLTYGYSFNKAAMGVDTELEKLGLARRDDDGSVVYYDPTGEGQPGRRGFTDRPRTPPGEDQDARAADRLRVMQEDIYRIIRGLEDRSRTVKEEKKGYLDRQDGYVARAEEIDGIVWMLMDVVYLKGEDIENRKQKEQRLMRDVLDMSSLLDKRIVQLKGRPGFDDNPFSQKLVTEVELFLRMTHLMRNRLENFSYRCIEDVRRDGVSSFRNEVEILLPMIRDLLE